jgi:pSer/pThr/pTyr-binding forkhead associated (FHA) protein
MPGIGRKQPEQAPAWLRPMQPDPLAAPGQTFKPSTGAPIPLTAREITFGTDPRQASHVLHDPSLEPRHARITRTEKGDFFVVDAGTIGGTWVNFNPIGQEGYLLRHGDMIHFGQLVFRFELKEPPELVQPKVTKLPPEA